MYKDLFSLFLKANEGKYHFACHSHHFWPDISFEAQKQYWLDTAKLTDNKWGYFFSEKIPRLNQILKKILNLTHQNITYAPNTHELLYRVITSIPPKSKKLKILTTDSEFYSFQRQIVRLMEEDIVEVDFIQTLPFDTFEDRMIAKSKSTEYDLAFFSNVFFNNGFFLQNFENLAKNIKARFKMIDGYHSFMALPQDLSFINEDTFFIAGGYKYAASGEGCCFLVSPENCQLRPYNTGWFAELGELESADHSNIKYSNDGLRFAGATLDFTALYRMLWTLEMYETKNISVTKIHNYVSSLQSDFLTKIKDLAIFKYVINTKPSQRGHFLAINCQNKERCQAIVSHLHDNNILCDNRNEILRFGFSIYQDDNDISYLVEQLKIIDKEFTW